MDERDRIETEREPRTVERHTTVVTTGDRGGGGSGVLIAVVLLIALLVGLFLFFGDMLTGAADEVDVKVDVEAPELPDIEVPAPANSTGS